MLIQVLALGLTILIPFTPFLIPSTVKMITRISFSKGKAAPLFVILGKSLTEAALATPFSMYLFYLYTPNPPFDASYLLMVISQAMFPVQLVSLASGSLVYEKAISYFEEDSAEIIGKINALGTRVNPKRSGKEEESSIRREIEIEIQYLSSQLLEKRKTIARVRRNVNRLYPSEKMTKTRKLALLLMPTVLLVAMSLPSVFLASPPFTGTLGAGVIGISVGLFLLFVSSKEEKMSNRMRQCRKAIETAKTMEKEAKATKQKRQQREKK